MELERFLPSSEESLASLLRGAELAVPSALFGLFITLWAMTSYSISTESASATLFPLRIATIHMEYIGRLRIDRGLLDRFLGTNRVSFLSRQGKVLQQWSYVRLDKRKLSLLRKFALLIASLRMV